ncbi:DUF1524 domain-containing protein [Ruegeria litorea]|uniref:DUF1524 domain-containing protein n=1 Tax=Falsiruegeria litorea TaxID=1280831 RepID=A0ABS5WVX4_9RHOB|nr:DUF1524 domain-containing protein [Falsiruegeria litorea]MBT3143216.1 DUF1524 domain-containing protein [Falsiruegeria litorea]
MAEAFILIAFALLLLFAFWQWEKENENPPEVVAFRELPYDQRQTVLVAAQDGSMEAFITLKEQGVDFATPASVENPQEKWRFIDQDEVLRLMDAASSLPEDIQRDLADMVESQQAHDLLKEMAILEDLVESGQEIADLIASSDTARKVEESGLSVEELLGTAQIVESLETSGHSFEELLVAANAMKELAAAGSSLEDLLATAQTLAALEQAGQSLEDISQKIRNAEAQEAALVGALRRELGGLVSKVGGRIDDSGAIILPDTILFDQGKAQITPVLGKFLADACGPWLTVLKGSGVDIAEVKIEGHASSEWRSGSSARQAYLGNLDLSQRRSQAVLRSCLDFVSDKEVLEWARTHMIAVGYSSVRPVMRDGEEDRVASRRVVFSASPNRENLIDQIETEAVAYNRARFGRWTDPDGNCLDTRGELLAQMSTGQVTSSEDGCKVIRGKWTDPYSGRTLTNAQEVDVDHLVPLKWAWDRGASSWSQSKRIEFANDPTNLFVVHDHVNREKGAMGPDEWMPPKVEFQCEYITRFMRVATKYSLRLKPEEKTSVEQLRQYSCS